MNKAMMKQSVCRAVSCTRKRSPCSSITSLSSSSQRLSQTRNLGAENFARAKIQQLETFSLSLSEVPVKPASNESSFSRGSVVESSRCDDDIQRRRDQDGYQPDQRRDPPPGEANLEHFLGDFVDSPVWKQLFFAFMVTVRLDSVLGKVLANLEKSARRFPFLQNWGIVRTLVGTFSSSFSYSNDVRLLASRSNKKVLRLASEEFPSPELLSPATVKREETSDQDESEEWGHFAYYDEDPTYASDLHTHEVYPSFYSAETTWEEEKFTLETSPTYG